MDSRVLIQAMMACAEKQGIVKFDRSQAGTWLAHTSAQPKDGIEGTAIKTMR